MSFSRYLTVPAPGIGRTSMSTAGASIRFAVINGVIKCDTFVLEEGRRLDQISAERYGDSSYWWVIAAASGIGWALQLPPGTLIIAPRNIGDALSLVI